MSTELKTNLSRHSALASWGGDNRGMTISITAQDSYPDPHTPEGYIRLDISEAHALMITLRDFVVSEAERRQLLLKSKIAEMKIAEKTVFHEISEMKIKSIEILEIPLITKICPII